RTGTNLASGVTVNYQVVGGTAINGTHYATLAPGTLTFAAGQTSARINVDFIDNGAADHDRTIVLALSSPTGGATLGAATQATMTIVDDEQEIQFSATLYSVGESGSATITVTRGGPTTTAATVNYSAVAGSATAGPDFKPVSGTLTFGVGATS